MEDPVTSRSSFINQLQKGRKTNGGLRGNLIVDEKDVFKSVMADDGAGACNR
jgi:hypothetical protein